jgi:hypothetical protein
MNAQRCSVCNSGNATPYTCNICHKRCCNVCVGVVHNKLIADCKTCFKANYKVVCELCEKPAATPVLGFDFTDRDIKCLRVGCQGKLRLLNITT